MFRIAVPNKGSLSEPAVAMLREAGYKQRRDTRELVLADPDNGVEFFFLRPRDVAVYVGAGTVDAGITGRDLLLDSGAEAVEHLALGFARSTFRFAAPAGTMTSVEQIAGQRVATSYNVLVANHLADKGIYPKDVVHLDGAVESSVKLGVADIIADVVETGTTLRAAGLDVFGEPILTSEAVLIRPRQAEISDGLNTLTRRLQGVMTAHEYVLMDYDVQVNLVDAAVAVTPGLESPTVSPLHDSQWVAVRAMVKKSQTNKVMDELYAIGARAILVTAIVACRL
ncbi:ATP phosphoribosyltransferase [Jonesia denitrificans]|uniref:ATP phosphoribosyltransferase n=1 Tax=Jonesia denitrificans (strain ATCC 14870 / DSM 20603 / BCRC 15368 / CIP 55.134 / JCM 11481 / NBRC 15587 / NCTC 10816 / Prevot 55134) TaxID=471856 RepID=C7R4A8_JONDD|nr:ATP phosphoribosyltransferase [Jonesia denitrificans]ACV08965.1 ATP phosphoribosyltransferase [Jonesia denitrificans DSM 20603]ASE09732.1 ATP phosphoribosyltransferase [Jonesia denitrificans]QXB44269.1 ATP phosphoribosyltransferase [Jonesia denitrificans]SQH21048.1 ATP phosphoribosyltransferase [Jonesia denitrificans]